MRRSFLSWVFFIFLWVAVLVLPHPIAASPLQGDPVSYGQIDSGFTFSYPYQMDSDGSGNLYVTNGQKVRKYDSSGTFLFEFGQPFGGPTGVAVAQSGDILVVNDNDDVIDIFNSSGVYQSSFGSTGTGNNQFNFPYAIAVDGNGNIYVADASNNRVQKFDASFTYLATITGNGGAFNFPEAVAVDSSNNLYVLDSGNNRVQKFDASGVYQMTVTGNGSVWNYPEGLTVDGDGNIYVADSGNNRIQVFDASGTFQNEMGSSGVALGEFDYVTGLLIQNNTLYVGDHTRLQTFIFDRTNPVTTVDAVPGGSTSDTTPEMTGSTTDATSTISSVEYSFSSNPGVWTACVAADGAFDELSESFTCSGAAALSPGSITVYVRATDATYNVNTSGDWATTSFTVTSTAAILSPSSSSSSSSTSSSTSSSSQSPPPPPDAYPVITGSASTEDSITIIFDHWGENITTYSLSYGTDPSAAQFAAYPMGDANSESFTIASLEPATTYYFVLTPMNGSTAGPSSPIFAARTLGVSTDIPYGMSTEDIPASDYPAAQPAPAPSPAPGGSLVPSATPFAPLPTVRRLPLSPQTVIRAVTYGAGGIGLVMMGSALVTIVATLAPVYAVAGRSFLWFVPDIIRALSQWLWHITVVLAAFVTGGTWRKKKMLRKGVVYTTDGLSPLSGVFMVFYTPSGNLATTYTTYNGTYRVSPKPDSYMIRASKLGFVYPATSSVTDFGRPYTPGEVIEVTADNPTISDYSVALDPR